MYVEVKQLGSALRAALDSVNYGATDVSVEPAESIEPHVSGGSGQRGFVIVVNVETGEFHGLRGSWGGSNIGNPTNPVDLSSDKIDIPPNGAVIKGTTGHPRTFAWVFAHPEAFGKYLPSGVEEGLTEVEQQALYCFGAIKGGEYRRDEMRRRGVTVEVVDVLVARGYLKRNRSGATQITTKGKNARTVRI